MGRDNKIDRNYTPPGITPRDLRKALNEVDKEDPSPEAKAMFHKLLTDLPHLWKLGGDLAMGARDKALNTNFTQWWVKQSILTGLERLEQDLNYDSSPVLERLVIQDIMLCWVVYQTIQNKYQIVMDNNPTLAQGRYWEQRVNITQGRFLRACESLSRLRKMEVSIKLQQINITNGKVNLLNKVTD